mmetsp:Transcript_51956/g.110415  ORF Transcript_51956/g.110415 Transcript_51956/m.110415 type:complete len:129 (-) Transcript_51956:671-1057(-)
MSSMCRHCRLYTIASDEDLMMGPEERRTKDYDAESPPDPPRASRNAMRKQALRRPKPVYPLVPMLANERGMGHFLKKQCNPDCDQSCPWIVGMENILQTPGLWLLGVDLVCPLLLLLSSLLVLLKLLH